MVLPALLHQVQQLHRAVPGASGDRLEQVHVLHAGQAQLLQPGAGADEVLHELAGGFGEDPLGGVVLDDLRAFVEHGDPVPELDRLIEVVGHAHDGLLQLVLDVDQLVLQTLTGDGVHGAEGLVHEQHGRVGGQGAGDAHALLLPAGQLPGVAVPVGVRVQGDQVQQLVHPLGDAPLVPPEHLGYQADVLGHGHVRQEPAGLDDVADLAAQPVPVHAGDVLPVDDQTPLGGFDEPVDHLQGGGLPAPGGSDEHDGLPGGDLQGQVVHGGLAGAVALGHVLDEDLRALLPGLGPGVLPGGVGRGGGGVLRHGYPLRWSGGR
ncbi:Uncharacterised protein [Mycobacteroides abscessus subsp. abscessus]|nr:Uncharacterised protein [Mycobacteroides abscessus subsp. abscessus]